MGLFGWIKALFVGKDDERIPRFMYGDMQDTITLSSDSGEDVEFVRIAGIDLGRGRYYAILQPVELMGGMGKDDALVFRVSVDSDGSDSFEIVTDEKVLSSVFAKFNEIIEEE